MTDVTNYLFCFLVFCQQYMSFLPEYMQQIVLPCNSMNF